MRQARRFVLIAMTALLSGVAGVAWSQSREAGGPAGGRARDLDCQQLLAEMQRLGGELIQLDQELDRKSQAMQRAVGDEQLEAMQAVIETIIEQRRPVFDRIKVSHQMLVYHLLAHLMVEPPEDGRTVLRACVLMDYMRRSSSSSGSGAGPDGPLDR